MNEKIARWTTPSILYKPSEVGVGDVEQIYVTLRQKGEVVIEKETSSATITDDGFEWDLTQEETSLLDRNCVIEIQVDYTTTDGYRYTTIPRVLTSMNSAVDGVIT